MDYKNTSTADLHEAYELAVLRAWTVPALCRQDVANKQASDLRAELSARGETDLFEVAVRICPQYEE